MNLNDKKIGIVGATGVVGRELIRLFEEQTIAPQELKLMASSRSVGQSLGFNDQPLKIFETSPDEFQGLDLLFFCSSTEVSCALIPQAVNQNIVCVDNSSAFRQDPQVPLVIPEVNAQDLANHKGIIANPNCSTIIMLVPLAALHNRWGLSRIVVSTYQAASGAGLAAMNELENQTKDFLNGTMSAPNVFKYPIAFNLFSHDSPIADNGYCGEENKMILESRKILGLENLEIVPTTVRVPILRAHTEAIVATFDEVPDENEARKILGVSAGLKLVDNRQENHFPMPLEADQADDILVGRLRRDQPNGKSLAFLVSGDQIRKGAALNALQIAQAL